MATYFTVGEFAGFHGVSKQTLQLYDRIGLLKPDYVDPVNGYRYYEAAQLEVLDTVFILKEIGVSLKDIRKFLQERTTEDAIELLSSQKELLDRRIAEQIRTRDRLDKKLDILKAVNRLRVDDGVTYEYCPAQFIYCEPVDAPYTLLECDIAIKRLIRMLTEKGYAYNYQVGVKISRENIMDGNYLLSEKVFSFLESEVSDAKTEVKPEGLYATVYHKGAYREESRAYGRLLEAIDRDGCRIAGGSYEICLVDNLSAGSEKDYITQISIEVTKP